MGGMDELREDLQAGRLDMIASRNYFDFKPCMGFIYFRSTGASRNILDAMADILERTMDSYDPFYDDQDALQFLFERAGITYADALHNGVVRSVASAEYAVALLPPSLALRKCPSFEATPEVLQGLLAFHCKSFIPGTRMNGKFKCDEMVPGSPEAQKECWGKYALPVLRNIGLWHLRWDWEAEEYHKGSFAEWLTNIAT